MPDAQRQIEMQRWVHLLEELITDVSRWAVQRDWSIRRIEKRVDDRELGSHFAPALLLQKETARVILEPIARSADGADGVVDLYLLPAYDDIATLYHEPEGWILQYAFQSQNGDHSAAAESEPLTEAAFSQAIEEMVKHAVSAG